MTATDLQKLLALFDHLDPEAQRRVAAKFPPDYRRRVRRLWHLAGQVQRKGFTGLVGVKPSMTAYLEHLLTLDALAQCPTSRIRTLARTTR
jgi:hypothetical protein